MGEAVVLPLWAFLILAGFAGWAVLVLLLVPGMRWFFRRRIKLVLHQIGGRLRIELPSFKLTRRQVLIDRLFHDPKVQAAAAAHAVAGNEALGEIWRRIDRYAREIVPSFNAYIYYRVGYALARAAATVTFFTTLAPRFFAAVAATLTRLTAAWTRAWPLSTIAFASATGSGCSAMRASTLPVTVPIAWPTVSATFSAICAIPLFSVLFDVFDMWGPQRVARSIADARA